MNRKFLAPLLEIGLPLLLFVLIIVFHPQALDIRLETFFADGNDFPMRQNEVMTWIHRRARRLTNLVLLATFLAVVLGRWFPRFRVTIPEGLCVLLGSGLSVLAISWLKATTGVHCPFESVAFGGPFPVFDPSLPFAARPGKCWPGGFAGTGFCLFSFWFAFRDRKPKLARGMLVFALLFGVFCGTIQLWRGLHFPSHNIETLLLDYAICAAVYHLFMRRWILRSARTLGEIPAAPAPSGT